MIHDAHFDFCSRESLCRGALLALFSAAESLPPSSVHEGIVVLLYC
jgi:hypothetical protein